MSVKIKFIENRMKCDTKNTRVSMVNERGSTKRNVFENIICNNYECVYRVE